MKFRSIALFVIAFGAAGAARLQAQSVVLKDGSHINAADLQVGDGKLTRNVTLSNGQKAQASVSFSDIDHLDWSDPQELLDARNLLASGKTKEAIAVLLKSKDFFAQFKKIPGSPYNDFVFAYADALDQAGEFDMLLKAMPEINGIKWPDDKKLPLEIIKLNMNRRTSSDQEKVLSDAESLRDSTDDSSVRAKLSMTIGDIHFKKERWEAALDAYLQVPVFYGSQATLVPQAELMAARCLQKMERFKDAAAMFQRISDTYPGSETGATAKKEFLTVNGLQNKPDKPEQNSNDSKKKTEAKS